MELFITKEYSFLNRTHPLRQTNAKRLWYFTKIVTGFFQVVASGSKCRRKFDQNL
jgi:hypothetical protein